MNALAAALALLLATQAPAPEALLRDEIAQFVGHLQAGRLAAAFALLTDDAQDAAGRVPFDAYVASRRRALGAVTGVDNVRRSEAVDEEHGMTIYEADVRFEKGTSRSWFVLVQRDAGWRILKFGLDMPKGISLAPGAGELTAVIGEILARVQRDGALAIVPRFSKKDLAAVKQTPESARAAMQMAATVLGPLESYTVGAVEESGDAGCSTVRGDGKFRYGSAPLVLGVCWDDGFWRLRHLDVAARITPLVVERSLAWVSDGKIAAKCPAGAPLPVDGRIVCRLTQADKPAKDATIQRTGESSWKVIAVAPAEQ